MLYKVGSRGALRSLLSSSRAHRSRITTAATRTQSRAIRLTVSRSIPQRSFCSSPASFKGITPGSSDPAPPNPEPNYIGVKQVTEASYISEPEYRDRSEEYINALMAEIERTQEEQGSEVEAEYSVCEVHLSGMKYLTAPYLHNVRHRPEFSTSSSLESVPTSSISSPRTSRYGSARPYLAPSGSTGSFKATR